MLYFSILWLFGALVFAESEKVFANQYLIYTVQTSNIKYQIQNVQINANLWEKWVGANFHAFCDYAVKRALVL